jgi:hypothetical protein
MKNPLPGWKSQKCSRYPRAWKPGFKIILKLFFLMTRLKTAGKKGR